MKKNKQRIRFLTALLLCTLFVIGCGSGKLTEHLAHSDTQEAIAVHADDRYVYQTLSAKRQHTYDQMLAALMNMRDSVRLTTRDPEEVQTCYEAICADYGEIFWVQNCSTRVVSIFGYPMMLYFDVNYTFTPEQVQDFQAQMQPKIDEYMAGLAGCDNDYEKTEFLYKKLISEVGYDLDAENNQNILSVFLGGQTVCQGYACAVQYLLEQAGIQCAIVTGTARGEAHAWNLVRLDGDYYYLDVTWGNASYRASTQPEDAAFEGVNFAYLNLTSEELMRTHEPAVHYELPVCESTQDSYFVRHGLYFEHWDAEQAGACLTQAYHSAERSISMKFADETQLAMACTYLIDERHFRDYCTDAVTICYMADTDLGILNVFFVD